MQPLQRLYSRTSTISCRRQRGEMSLEFLHEPLRSLILRVGHIKELRPARDEPVERRHILPRHRHPRPSDGDIRRGHPLVSIALPEWPLIFYVHKQIGPDTAHLSQANIERQQQI